MTQSEKIGVRGVGLNVAACGGLINPLNAELNIICHLLALLGAHHILHVGRIRVKIALGFICVSNEAIQVHTNSQNIYFKFSTCFGQLCDHHQENLLYLCDTGIFHSVWVAVWWADQDRIKGRAVAYTVMNRRDS